MATSSQDRRSRSLATQTQVLDAAVHVLIEHGYAGASTLRIQQTASVSRGRLLHQYPSRDQLLVAAVQHLATARFADLGKRTEWPSDGPERVNAAIDAMWSTYQQGYFWAATELWMAARYNDELRAALLPVERRLGEQVRAATDLMFGPEFTGRAEYPATRELVNTSMRGVAMTYAFDRRHAPDDSHLALWKTIARQALLEPAANR